MFRSFNIIKLNVFRFLYKNQSLFGAAQWSYDYIFASILFIEGEDANIITFDIKKSCFFGKTLKVFFF